MSDVDLAAKKVLARCRKAAIAYGRPDLGDRVVTVLERLGDDALRVMLVGEFKHGKSSLLNALLGQALSPVDADVATSVPLVVRHGTEASATAIVDPGDGSGRNERVPFPLNEVAAWATEGGNPDNARGAVRVEVALPHPILEAGLAFVDTPGVGGLASTHGTITAAALPMADAVLFVSDAAQELSANEVEFLQVVRRVCPTVAYVVTKTDVYHEWRRIVEIDTGHLERAGASLPTFPVSALLRQIAEAGGDETLVEDSGFRPLMRWLARSVAKVGRQRTARLVAAEVDDITGQLATPFEAKLEALSSEDPAALVAELEAVKKRAERLKSGSGRWASTLNDGFADLQSDVDHDLRLRVRQLNRKADDMIDGFDPADAWAEFEPWLQRETGAVVTENYTMLVGRVRELVEAVSDVFGEESEGAEFVARITAAEELLAAADTDSTLDMNKTGLVGQGMSVLRGGYSAVGMFSTYAGMAGIALTNPVSAAVALVMGRKGMKDEKERQLNQRRAQAKAAARRYVDEVNFVVGKDSRDTMRHLQRDLRAHFTARAEEANRSAAAALAAANEALQYDASDRDARRRDIQAELDRLVALRTTIAELAEAEASDDKKTEVAA